MVKNHEKWVPGALLKYRVIRSQIVKIDPLRPLSLEPFAQKVCMPKRLFLTPGPPSSRVVAKSSILGHF